MGIKAKEWIYLTRSFSADKELMPDINWDTISNELDKNKIEYVEITIKQVVDWDRAPMRKYFHGVIIPHFTNKFNETCKHPSNGHFSKSEIKDFLKAKFIGWNNDNTNYDKWCKVLNLDRPVKDIFNYLQIKMLLDTLTPQIEPLSSEELTPEDYNEFINQCEKYYFELFHEMWDIREKPIL